MKHIGLIKPAKKIGYMAVVLLVAGRVCFAAEPASKVPVPMAPSALQPIVNIGVAPDMFTGIAQDDVVSAFKIWADSTLEQRGIHLGSNPRIYNNLTEMKQNLLKGNIDFMAMLTVDYLNLESEVGLGNLHFSMQNGSPAEEYVLLIQRESRISDLFGLKGKSIIIQTGFRENLSPVWLDTLLMQEGLDGASDHFKKIEFKENLLSTVLPVFFGKVDACLVTRNGIEHMVEMNPQVSSRIRILSSSNELVPSLFCVRSSYNSMLKNEFLSALRALDDTPPGQQVLHMFQAEKLGSGDASELSSTRNLIETYTKLKARRSAP
jgi:phosphonate transport system substrate-binding protein